MNWDVFIDTSDDVLREVHFVIVAPNAAQAETTAKSYMLLLGLEQSQYDITEIGIYVGPEE